MSSFLFEVGLKSVPLAILALIVLRLRERKSASAKFSLLAAVFATLVALPIAVAFSPKITVVEPPAKVVTLVQPEMTPVEPVSATAALSPQVRLDSVASELPWSASQVLLGFWAIGVLICWLSLIRDVCSVVRSLPTSTKRGTSIAWAGNDAFGPFVWGWKRPQVVLPSALRQWDHGMRSALIAHEMAHVQRGDWPLRIAFRLIRGAYWFNPLVWILEKRAAMESEIACDDLVVCAGTDPARYAEGLLEVAKMQRLSTAPGAGSPRLKTRLVALFDKTRDRSQAGRGIKAAALLAAVAGVAAVAPLSIGSEAPVETTRIPNILREATQSSINERPLSTSGFSGQITAKPAGGVTLTNKAGTVKATVNKQNAATAKNVSNKVNRAGQGGAGGSGSTSVNGQAPSAASQGGGSGLGSTSVNGSASGGQDGAGGFGSNTVNAQAPAVARQGGGAGFGGNTINAQAPAVASQGGGGAGFGSAGVSGAPSAAQGGAGSNHASATSAGGQQGGGFGGTISRVGQSGGGFAGTLTRSGQGANTVSTARNGHINQLTSRPGAGEGMVSAMTKTDEPLGTKIVDLGGGIFYVTHVTELGKFTAQGRNIELYKNGVVVVRDPLTAGQKAVREVAGYVTNAMNGRGSLAYVRPDAP